MSIERDSDTGISCLCVPFIDSMVRGGLRFKITDEEFPTLIANPQARHDFANKCRQRQCDERLLEPYLPRNGRPCQPGDSSGHPFVKEYASTQTLMIFIQQWFKIGYNFDSKQHFIAIKVDFSTQIQGTEDYALTNEEFNHLVRHPDELIALAAKCQRRQNDERLITHYEIRGTPWHCPPET